MADDKTPRRPLLDQVQDQEPTTSTAIWRDKPGSKTSGEAAAGDAAEGAKAPAGPGLGLTLAVSLVVSLLVGGGVHLLDKKAFEAELSARLGSGARAASADAASGDAAPGKAAEQITALQKQLDVVRREQLLAQQSTRESLERISTVLKNPQLAPAAVATAPSATPGTAHIPDAAPALTPTQEEFIQLKERNRLTQYADEAIATGMRKPLEAIVEYMQDPQSERLHEAAKAEYLRAVRAIQIIQREDPGYRIPVAEVFKGQNVKEEADLKPSDLLKLLADHKQPWEARSRACFLLLGSTAPETNEKLIEAVKSDPSLEVAKQAQICLEQRVKRRFRIFDIPAIEAWWKSQTH